MKDWHTAYVGLGSNLAEPLRQVTLAMTELASLENTQMVNVSNWYRSKAIGPGQQPDYINGAAQLETQLQPLELLDKLQNIEAAHHRERVERWGARTLDLDLLLYDNLVIDHPRLSVPHPRIHERNFVLFPLRDLAPELIVHHSNTHIENSSLNRQAVSVEQLCEKTGNTDLTRL